MTQINIQGFWQKGKILLKGGLIAALTLFLLIPAHFVKGIIEERSERQKEAVAEVSGRWAGPEQLMGPVLVIPYRDEVPAANEAAAAGNVRRYAYVLPEKLKVGGELQPVKKHRGIFDVMLYRADLQLSGRFPAVPLQQLRLNAQQVLWDEAYIAMGLSDAKGLREEIQLTWNYSVLVLNPGVIQNHILTEGFSTPVSLAAGQPVDFSAKVKLQGSGQFFVVPTGKTTEVDIHSSYHEPSFVGAELPEYTLDANGFTAHWRSMAHNRNFPQAWKEQTYQLQSAALGVDLFIPANDYQKTMRSVKYALLCILLTFSAFFLIETAGKRSVHPLHYALVGLALILFYTLLLSLSEFIGFNLAYALAASATIGLITWFLSSVLSSVSLAAVMALVLALQYTYIFVILQLQDTALLFGSIGLFVVLAVIMYFSRKIKW